MSWIYNILLSIWIFVLLCLSSDTNDKVIRILMLGETGKGKSTIIKKVFKVIENVAIGHTPDSETFQVDSYYNKMGYMLYDTPGFFDNANLLTDDQIKEMIETELTSSNNNVESIDALIVVTSTKQNKDQTTRHLTEYATLFGEKMLQSLIVIINQFENDSREEGITLKGYLMAKMENLLNKCKTCENMNIPVLLINGKNPTSTDIEIVYNKIKHTKEYKLTNLKHKYNAIKEIFDNIMKNTTNYKDEIKYTIVNETRNITRQALKRVAKTISVSKCHPTNNGFSIMGISYTSTKMKCNNEGKVVTVDEIVTLNDKMILPTTKNETHKVLKNEKHVYWENAKKLYKESMLKQFRLKNKAKQDI